MGVQDDVFAAARAGIVPTSVYLSLLPHYKNETEYYVWSNIISNLSVLETLYPPLPLKLIISFHFIYSVHL